MGESQNKKTTTLVLIGKTGNGKSATGNSILGRTAFVEKSSLKSVTKECQLANTDWKDGDGRVLRVVDTPGLFDTDADQKDVAKEIVNCIQLAKDGVHGVLLVTSVQNRFTAEEAAIFECLQILFGPQITDYVVVVFTKGDKLVKQRKTLEEQLKDAPETLKNVLRRYNDRKVLFNNKGDSQTKKAQLTELLREVDNLVTVNGGKPYSNEVFRQFQEMTRKFGGQPSGSEQVQGYSKEELSQIVEMMEKKMEEVVAKLQQQLSAAHRKVQILEHEIGQRWKCWPLF